MRQLKTPFRIDDNGSAFKVQSADGIVLAFVYYREDQATRDVLRQLSRDEARAFAERIAATPEAFPMVTG